MHLADEVVIHVRLSGAHDAISNIENVHCIGWRLTIINANSMTDTIQWTFHHIVALQGRPQKTLLPGNGTEACWGFASLNDEYRLNVWQIAIWHIRYDIHTWPRELTDSQLNREPSARSQGTEM